MGHLENQGSSLCFDVVPVAQTLNEAFDDFNCVSVVRSLPSINDRSTSGVRGMRSFRSPIIVLVYERHTRQERKVRKALRKRCSFRLVSWLFLLFRHPIRENKWEKLFWSVVRYCNFGWFLACSDFRWEILIIWSSRSSWKALACIEVSYHLDYPDLLVWWTWQRLNLLNWNLVRIYPRT